jgi:YVTN family beta-propeller protein
LYQGLVHGIAVSFGVAYATLNGLKEVARTNLPSTAFTDGRVTTSSFPVDVAFNSSGNLAYVLTQATVDVIDVGTNTKIGQMTLPGGGGSTRLIVSRDDRKVYVRKTGGLHIFDTASRSLIQTIPLTLNAGGLWGLTRSPDGTRIYIMTCGSPCASENFSIVEIDGTSDTIVRTLATGGRGIHAVAVSQDGGRLYGVGIELVVFDLMSGSLVASVYLSGEAMDVAVTPDNAQIWVAFKETNGSESRIEVFDSQTLQLITSITTGGQGSLRIAFDPFGSTVFATNLSGWVDCFQAQVHVTVPLNSGVGRVLLTPSKVSLDSRAGIQMESRLVDAMGRVLSDPVAYSTTTPTNITVDGSGLATGLAGGVGSATASAGSRTATVPITVYGHPTPTLSATTTLPDRTYGTAISTQGVFMATRFTGSLVAKGTLPGTAIESNIPVGSTPTTIAFNASGTTAYVTNQTSGTLSIIDVATGAQLSELRLEGSASGTGQGGTNARPPATDSALSAALSRRAAVPDAGPLASPVPLLGNPFGVTVSPDDGKVYVGIISSNIVQVVDPVAREVVRNITLGGSGPTSFAWSPDGTRFYVNSTSSGVITEIDATTDAVVRTFSTGGRPQGMAVSRDGAELYVADEDREMLDVWQLSSLTRIASTPLGAGGLELQLTPDNARIWISMKTQGRVLVIDRATRQVLQPVPTGGRPRQIGFDLFGTTAVVANDLADALHFIR